MMILLDHQVWHKQRVTGETKETFIYMLQALVNVICKVKNDEKSVILMNMKMITITGAFSHSMQTPLIFRL